MKTKQLLLNAVILVMTTAICGLKATAQSVQAHLDFAANSLKSADVNGDGAVDVADISSVISYMAGGTFVSHFKADVNGDGAVDVADISTIIVIMAGKGVADETAYITCPDENHPHWIDLGIGTRWRCCNEGASRPEEYGGYYQFGQVASAPTLDQIKALVNDCSYTWTTQNGVNGGKFTGPNGGTIFLPAAGFRWDSDLYYAGSDGYYWSSALNESDPNNAFNLYFYSGGVGTGYSYRYGGFTVRPVR